MGIPTKHIHSMASSTRFNLTTEPVPFSANGFIRFRADAQLFGLSRVELCTTSYNILQSYGFISKKCSPKPNGSSWFIMVHHHFSLLNGYNWSYTHPYSQARRACPRSDQFVSIEASFFIPCVYTLRALLLIGLAIRMVQTESEPAIMHIYWGCTTSIINHDLFRRKIPMCWGPPFFWWDWRPMDMFAIWYVLIHLGIPWFWIFVTHQLSSSNLQISKSPKLQRFKLWGSTVQPSPITSKFQVSMALSTSFSCSERQRQILGDLPGPKIRIVSLGAARVCLKMW